MRKDNKFEVAIIVTANCSLLSALLLVEPLMAANRLSGSSPFRHYFASVDGRNVRASNGFVIAVDRALANLPPPSLACLVASYEQPKMQKAFLFKALRRFVRHGTILCGVDLGVPFLAEAGLIGDRRVSVHWETHPAFQEKWPDIEATEELYSFDRGLMSCGGHTASLDMILAFVAERFNDDLARAVSNEMLTSGFRPPTTPQRHVAELEPWSQHPILSRMVRKMNEQIEQAPRIDELISSLQISRRQVEYLSKKFLGVSPAQYFLRLRLQRSRELLLYSDAPVANVGAATGFSSASIFSRSFQRHFGVSPTTYRSRWKTSMSRPYIK